MPHPLTVLITGATTGIGKAVVLQTSTTMPGSTILIVTRHKLDYDLPNRAEVLYVDLTDHAKIEKIVQTILQRHPRIDILINNAGDGWRGMIEDTTIAEAKQQLELNVWALMH